MDKFFADNNITDVSGLFLDVEGVESVILHQLFEKTTVRPRVIRFEYPHIKDREDLEHFIRQQGYTIWNCSYSHTSDKIPGTANFWRTVTVFTDRAACNSFRKAMSATPEYKKRQAYNQQHGIVVERKIVES